MKAINQSSAFAALAKKAIACALLAIPVVSQAAYPDRSVRMVVPFPAGGGTDLTARVLASHLSDQWGQTVVVENRAGASGMIGAESVARAEPDGYTILLGTPAETAINKALYPKMAYDPFDAFQPVSLVAKFPLVIVANPSVAAKNAAELQKEASSTAGGLPFASAGVGSMQHLTGEWLVRNANLRLFHVAYKGTGPAVSDLIGGQVPVAVMGLGPLVGHIKTGRVNAVAVTSARRNALLPDIPTLKESGIDFVTNIWFGVFAPKGTPADITEKLNASIQSALKDPAVAKRIRELGGEPEATTAAEFQTLVQQDYSVFEELIRTAKLRPE